MVSIVETAVETRGQQDLSIQLLGPLAVRRDGAPVELPRSRKLRALLAYLVLAPRPVSRSRLCDLLWDGPNDPRGELRWCLTRLRSVLDDAGVQRVETPGDAVGVNLAGCSIDATLLASAVADGLDRQTTSGLVSLSAASSGPFLDGLEIDRCPDFLAWLSAQRRRFHAMQVAVAEQAITRFPIGDEAAAPHVERWLDLSPFDLRAHHALLAGLCANGRFDACERHLAEASDRFTSEDMDPSVLTDMWRKLRSVPIAAQARNLLPDHEGQVRTSIAADRNQKRASLAVMPFVEQRSGGVVRGGLADGLTHDIITRLARLRDFFVIARGSVFALADRGLGPEEAGRRLDVDYVASGFVRRNGGRDSVSVELVDVPSARIIWSDTFEPDGDDLFLVLDDIGNSIVASISTEIEMTERNRAILKAPSSLNAWEAYHRGLWHMYRFTREENEKARQFFGVATSLDPTFARAHAGLSFTHWQSAFQRWGDRDRDIALAYEAAGESVLIDDHNPAAHWAMGRALWLRGSNEESLSELARAVDLSPNFALGHYALSFVASQSGDPLAAIGSADHSRHLSPFDPLLFGMLAARAMAHVRLGHFEEAAEWSLKAAARPNPHAIILAIAACCLGLAGRIAEGRALAGRIRESLPHYGVDAFLAAFRFEPDAAALFRQGARNIGMD